MKEEENEACKKKEKQYIVNLSEQRADWLEIPTLYIKCKEEKWHGNCTDIPEGKINKFKKINKWSIISKRQMISPISKTICPKKQNNSLESFKV